MTVTTQRDSEKIITWDHMRNQSATPIGVANTQNRALPKLMVWFTLFVSVIYLVYTLKLISSTRACHDDFFAADIHHHRRLRLPIRSPETTPNSTFSSEEQSIPTQIVPKNETTAETHLRKELKLNEIVFGIAASAKYWEKRKNYIQLWWKPEKMRGVVWLDSPVKTHRSDLLPPVRISGNTSKFAYKNKQGHRSAIRISRIVSETLRLGGNGNGMKNVKWFVMGDDDTVFVTENLIRVLGKYDYNEMYYIGGISESHLQNIYFSYGMAYGGGGFAISYPLAKALEKMQDECIGRYSGLYGSDDRMQACMAELGVPLTKELGFHQFDVYGNLFGLLAAHPVTPLVTLHHLDVVEPIFPNVTRVQALQRLTIPMKLDSAGLMQQSICYDKSKKWTVSVSWGFAVQIYRGVLSPREMEMPSRTFLNWYRRADYTAYAFNTRPVGRNPCQRSFVFYLSKAGLESSTNLTVSDYIRHRVPHPLCKWKMQDPAEIERVKVYKKPDPHLWERSPRRNCCRILESKRSSMVVDVGVCREGEFSEI